MTRPRSTPAQAAAEYVERIRQFGETAREDTRERIQAPTLSFRTNRGSTGQIALERNQEEAAVRSGDERITTEYFQSTLRGLDAARYRLDRADPIPTPAARPRRKTTKKREVSGGPQHNRLRFTSSLES